MQKLVKKKKIGRLAVVLVFFLMFSLPCAKAAHASVDDHVLSESAWSESGNDYYFSVLTTAQKKLYINLKKNADYFLGGTEDVPTLQVKRNGKRVTIYAMPQISYQGLTLEDARVALNCFLFENPQYYFLRNSTVWSEDEQQFTVGVYAAFANGKKRAAVTREFREQLETWEAQIGEQPDVVAKEKMIHQLVCEHVAYDHEAAEAIEPEDPSMSQSCISAVLYRHTTLCTGYAQLFSLLCNRAGISCVTVTSKTHAWNLVRMGTVWYAVDCTSDDQENGFSTAFFNVTDAGLESRDAAHYKKEAYWKGIVPPCTEDFDEASANAEDMESNIVLPDKMRGISVRGTVPKQIQVVFSRTEGCDGYQIQYAAKKTMKPNKKKLLSKTSCRIIGLKSGKKYYVRLRGYVLDSNGDRYFGEFSNKLPIVVR